MAFISGFSSRGISSGQLSGSRSLYITNFVKLKKPRKISSIISQSSSNEMASLTMSRYSCTPSLVRGISKSGISIPCSNSLAWSDMFVMMSSPVHRSLNEPFTLRRSSSTGTSISGAFLNSAFPLSSCHFKKPRAR